VGKNRENRWFVFGIFFGFMLLHQADMLLIGPLTTPIMETFHINEAQMRAVVTGALIVGGILYPVWGYLYDRYSRPKLLALASFIWGSTTWLSALAPTFPVFVATRASTGIDDASDPGIYSLLADYFAPAVRGRVYALLQISAPLGYIVGMVLATAFKDVIGWRGVFYVTGSLGLVLSVIIFLGVRDAARGSSEPELQNVASLQEHHFEWRTAGLIAVRLDLRTAIVVICTSTWAVCALLLVGAIILVPRDIEAVRAELRLRAQTEQTPP